MQSPRGVKARRRHDLYMTLDPDEGVGPNNIITTGVSAERISQEFVPVITRAVSSLVSLDKDIMAIYLYGSVATGRATVPTSDLDLLVVLNDGRAEAKIRQLAAELSQSHRNIVREVAIATVVISDIWADTADGLGSRCFIKHYCVHLHGLGVHQGLQPCRATREVAWAFNHNVGESVTSAKARLAKAAGPSQVAEVCRSSARRVSLAATSLVSVAENTWTTDRQTAAKSITKLYPEWGSAAEIAVRWCVAPSNSADEVREFLNGFASWVAHELKRVCAVPP